MLGKMIGMFAQADICVNDTEFILPLFMSVFRNVFALSHNAKQCVPLSLCGADASQPYRSGWHHRVMQDAS